MPRVGAAGEPDPQALVARAVDAARSAGATYADAKLTATREQLLYVEFEPISSVTHGLGVRVLVDGYWGFASSTVWSADEAARLARIAVAQARASGAGVTRRLELDAPPPVVRGEWIMPVKYDPFNIPDDEKLDVMNAFIDAARVAVVAAGAVMKVQFRRQQSVCASSVGSAWSQTTYSAEGTFGVSYRDQYSLQLQRANFSTDLLSGAGKGWEHIVDSGLLDQIPWLLDQAEQARHQMPVDAGRFDLVCTAGVTAALLDATLGAATELDRAMGDEANAEGTSYLSDPLDKLGTYVVGSPRVSITADRSTPGALATARWDDEGVVPDTFDLVRDGVLVDYQTTREQSMWLAPYYQRAGKSVRSHGCTRAESALSIPMQMAPNLRLHPGADPLTFEELVAATPKGIAVLGTFGMTMDQQHLNGIVRPIMRQITKGKLGPYIVGGGIMFRAPELWKQLAALGGPASARWFGMERGKGQPAQREKHSVGAVPAKFTNVSVIDIMRKA